MMFCTYSVIINRASGAGAILMGQLVLLSFHKDYGRVDTRPALQSCFGSRDSSGGGEVGLLGKSFRSYELATDRLVHVSPVLSWQPGLFG